MSAHDVVSKVPNVNICTCPFPCSLSISLTNCPSICSPTAVTRNLFTCSTPTSEEDAAGEAQPGEFARQVMPAPSFAEKMDRMDKNEGSSTP